MHLKLLLLAALAPLVLAPTPVPAAPAVLLTEVTPPAPPPVRPDGDDPRGGGGMG